MDDAPSTSAWDVVYTQTVAFSGARNPNGCRVPVTWFSTCCAYRRTDGSCEVVQAARRRGHELATHTKTHPKE